MTVELKIPLTAKKAHKIPPSILVLNDNGQVGVHSVTENNIVQFNPVEILSSHTDHNWITGLGETAHVIVQGQSLVTSGQEVIPTMKEQGK